MLTCLVDIKLFAPDPPANIMSATRDLIATVGLELGQLSILKILRLRYFQMFHTAAPKIVAHGHPAPELIWDDKLLMSHDKSSGLKKGVTLLGLSNDFQTVLTKGQSLRI